MALRECPAGQYHFNYLTQSRKQLTWHMQCAMPVFEGLIHPDHESIVQTLLFRLAEWHALAKLRLHTDHTIALLDQALRRLAAQVRHFQKVTCPAFVTKELPQETAQRQRREVSDIQSGRRKLPATSSPHLKSFNINTYKFHALGDYGLMIKTFRTTDLYTTQVVSSQSVLFKNQGCEKDDHYP